jgi:hypothetical protein
MVSGSDRACLVWGTPPALIRRELQPAWLQGRHGYHEFIKADRKISIKDYHQHKKRMG